jgi:hypothetical protein
MQEQVRYTPTADEQMFACLAHFLQMVGWFIGPLVIFLVKRESRFVAFHALQALLWQIVLVVLWMSCFAFFFVGMFSNFPGSGGSPPPRPPAAFFIFFPLIWLLMMGGWVLTLIFAIVYGVKAMRGEWAAYPVLGRWARRIAGV